MRLNGVWVTRDGLKTCPGCVLHFHPLSAGHPQKTIGNTVLGRLMDGWIDIPMQTKSATIIAVFFKGFGIPNVHTLK